jgi:hypothetical protein
MALSDLPQGCSITSLMQSWYKTNVTMLMTQGCNNTVISWLYRTCWNNLATNLIISKRFLQLLTSCSKLVDKLFQTCWQIGTSHANTTCWRPVGRLVTRCETFTRVPILIDLPLVQWPARGRHELVYVVWESALESLYCHVTIPRDKSIDNCKKVMFVYPRT